ncbi:MAG: DUF4253 domain-containing protein, partial [Lysobacterales bacterium]
MRMNQTTEPREEPATGQDQKRTSSETRRGSKPAEEWGLSDGYLQLDAINDQDFDRAVDWLLKLAAALAAAGFPDIAVGALALLREDGPWKLPRHGSVRHQYERLLRPVSLLAEVECPASTEGSVMSMRSLRRWAAEQASKEISLLSMPKRLHRTSVGEGWSPEALMGLPALAGPPTNPQPHAEFGRFCVDAETLLQVRVAAHFGRSFGLRGMLLGIIERLGVDASRLPGNAAEIDIAPEARATDNQKIVQAVANYLDVTGFEGGYLEPVFQPAWLLLVDQGRADAAVEVARAWLRQDPDAAMRMVDLSVVRSVARFLRSGKLAAVMGVDRSAAEAWLQKLRKRRRPRAPRLATEEIQSVGTRSSKELVTALSESPLAGLDWFKVEVIESPEHAWVARMSSDRPFESWRMARERISATGRWPLLTTAWGTTDDPEELSKAFFSRWSYEQGPAADDLSPAAIIAAARSIDLSSFFSGLNSVSVDSEWLELVQSELGAVGIHLSKVEVEAMWIDSGRDRIRFERALADKERAQGVSNPEHGRQPIFEPDEPLLVLLPTADGTESLAYMHWFGMEGQRPEAYVRLLKSWSERFGAEIYAHYGTMLEFTVSRPPTDFDTALALADEHERVAPCTLMLPGIPLRHYAEGLIGHQTWFLHERP